jgi:hypothetical protein
MRIAALDRYKPINDDTLIPLFRAYLMKLKPKNQEKSLVATALIKPKALFRDRIL